MGRVRRTTCQRQNRWRAQPSTPPSRSISGPASQTSSGTTRKSGWCVPRAGARGSAPALMRCSAAARVSSKSTESPTCLLAGLTSTTVSTSASPSNSRTLPASTTSLWRSAGAVSVGRPVPRGWQWRGHSYPPTLLVMTPSSGGSAFSRTCARRCRRCLERLEGESRSRGPSVEIGDTKMGSTPGLNVFMEQIEDQDLTLAHATAARRALGGS
mmetsp:Transcript_50014/g.159986  ORF Transcript_50014/g.159986 Transcript_50014/m.159986 type:complete len:213 (+) Transcript_50014:373-1011(+)